MIYSVRLTGLCNLRVVFILPADAIMNPGAALQVTVEDFLDSLSRSPGAAQAELINLVLRACGCNDSVDSDSVVDYDGVVDALDDFTEGLKKACPPFLPLFAI
jgi:cohesin complex subunit SA-1/2